MVTSKVVELTKPLEPSEENRGAPPMAISCVCVLAIPVSSTVRKAALFVPVACVFIRLSPSKAIDG